MTDEWASQTDEIGVMTLFGFKRATEPNQPRGRPPGDGIGSHLPILTMGLTWALELSYNLLETIIVEYKWLKETTLNIWGLEFQKAQSLP